MSDILAYDLDGFHEEGAYRKPRSRLEKVRSLVESYRLKLSG